MPVEPPTRPLHGDHQAVTQALADAAATAGYAPSIHNTQPWRWRLTGDTLDLFAERERMLAVTDPDARLATLSCGAALHHARVGLAAGGWHAIVTRMPNPDDPDHLARLRVDGRAEVAPEATRHARTILLRHTDRRPVTGTPVRPEVLAALAAEVAAQGSWLHSLRPDQVLDLATAASEAQRVESAESAWQAELEYWAGGSRAGGTGVPDAAIPHEPPRTTVPGRDFGRPGELTVNAGHDQGAVFAILYGQDDQQLEWLRAGEALSAVWLAATEQGVSVLPLSATVEVAGTRVILRRLVADLGYPYLVLRLGSVRADAAPRTPRLPADQIVQRDGQPWPAS